jgi:hypothetical protein
MVIVTMLYREGVFSDYTGAYVEPRSLLIAASEPLDRLLNSTSASSLTAHRKRIQPLSYGAIVWLLLLFSWTYSLAQPATTTTTDPPIDPPIDPPAEFVDIETPQILDNGWVIVPAQVQMLTQGKESARAKALEHARSEAVALIAGIEVKSASQDLQVSIQHNGQFVDGFDAFSALSDQQSYGRIDQEQVTADTIMVLAGTPYYKIRLRCHVVLEKSRRDPSFSLRAQLNQENFRHNDEMILNLKTTKDCHVTVFNLLTNGTVEVLYPQAGILEENLVANTVFEIPSLALRQQGIHLRKYADGKAPQAEALYVVVTNQRVPFLLDQDTVATMQYQTTAFLAVQRWLLNIPLDQRAEAMLQYWVTP